MARRSEVGGNALAPLRAGVAVFADEATAVRAFETTFPDMPSHRRWQPMPIQAAKDEWERYEKSTGMKQGSYGWVTSGWFAELTVDPDGHRVTPRRPVTSRVQAGP